MLNQVNTRALITLTKFNLINAVMKHRFKSYDSDYYETSSSWCGAIIIYRSLGPIKVIYDLFKSVLPMSAKMGE